MREPVASRPRPKSKDQRTFLRSVLNCFPSLFEHLAVPDKAGARIRGQLEVLRQLEAVRGTGFLTERTEHAARSIKNKFIQNFFAARLAGDHHLNVHRD